MPNNYQFQTVDKDTVAQLSFVGQDGQPFTIDLQQELSFSEHTFNQDLMAQAPRYAWWASVHTSAKEFLNTAKLDLEVIEAKLGQQARQTLHATGTKPTKDMVLELVVSSSDYQEARKKLIWWEGQVSQLEHVLKAFNQRSTALTQFGAQYRSEMNSQSNVSQRF